MITRITDQLVAQRADAAAAAGRHASHARAGSTTAQSLDAAVRSFDTLMARFPAKPPATAGEPGSVSTFDITECAAAAAEFGRTAEELRQLITSLDAQSPALTGAVATAVDSGQSLIDYLFLRAAALIVLLVAAVLGARCSTAARSTRSGSMKDQPMSGNFVLSSRSAR